MADRLKDLEGRPKGEDGKNQPREFFWDSIVLSVVFSILGLAAIDVISEYVRGSSVDCLVVNDSDGTQSYVNNFCTSSVPVSQYFPVFMVVHAILIGIPHYLWLNHYGGSFEFFFQLTSSIDRLRDYQTGEYSENNYLIVEQLESAFSTYKRNWIFRLYRAKLLLQWIFTVVGFIVAIVYFTDFNENFLCPQTENETFSNPMWPFPGQQINCAFTSLRLIELIRVADLVLLAIVVLGLTWSLVWCISTHSSTLGSKNVAKFSFQSGLAPKYYVPNLPIIVHRLFDSIPWPFSIHGPRIKTDLDFMVMKLFRTDGGLGHVLREVQILKEIKSLNRDEKRIVHLHKREQKLAKSGDLVDKNDVKADLKWTFEEVTKIYDNYKPVSEKLVLPDTIRGAILGYASFATSNKGAMYITFGCPSLSFADALARIFRKVVCFNFSPYYNNAEVPVKVDVDFQGLITVTCNEDYLTGDKEDNVKKLLDMCVEKNAWKDSFPTPTSFILIGALDKKSQKSTVNYFLERVSKGGRKIDQDSILLYVEPLNIAGKQVKFISFKPPEKHFVGDSSHQVEVMHHVKEMPWTAWKAKEVKEKKTEEPPGTQAQLADTEQDAGNIASKPQTPKSGEIEEIGPQEIELQERSKDTSLLMPAPAPMTGSTSYDLSLLVGNARGKFKFTLYKKPK